MLTQKKLYRIQKAPLIHCKIVPTKLERSDKKCLIIVGKLEIKIVLPFIYKTKFLQKVCLVLEKILPFSFLRYITLRHILSFLGE